jgi:uncharacterized lipoprotein YddW (UPF0748 family)
VCLIALVLAGDAEAQVNGQYRAFWVDTYNTRLNNVADVTAIVDRAKGAGANALFVQVRRRGDAWYLRGREPRPEGILFDVVTFDPLAEVLRQAHDAALEVHAFVVVGAIWNQNTLPTHVQHVFNRHGFTPAGPIAGADNWLTRTRLPDGGYISASGYRFGSDYWLDFGHPEAATYTVDLLLDLVRNYPIDGLHLDRLQYPELPASADGGASVGYNDVSLQRFRERYGRPAGSDPAANDPDWSHWRREQLTALMRRIYLNVVAIKPGLKISVGAIATGNAPGSDDGWLATDAYSRVYQDWRKWTEEGLLDIVIPLNFRAEHTTSEAEAFAGWTAWTRGHQYQRQAVMGIGSYLNSIEGTIRQIRAAFEPGATPLDGVVLYSIGAHNAPVTRNPLAVPAGRDTPLRTFDDLSSGLRTGRTVAGQALEAGSANANTSPLGVFATPVVSPFLMSATFAVGHVLGTIQGDEGRPLDSAEVVFESEGGVTKRVTTTDGGGVFGGANLTTGQWRVSVTPAGAASGRYIANCTLTITAGQVGRFDLQVDPARLGVASCQTPQSSRISALR